MSITDYLQESGNPMYFQEKTSLKPNLEKFRVCIFTQPKAIEFGTIGGGLKGKPCITPKAISLQLPALAD